MWASSYLSAARLGLLGQVHFFSFFPHVLTKYWCSSWEGEAGQGVWGVQVGQRGFGGQICKDVSVFRMTTVRL